MESTPSFGHNQGLPRYVYPALSKPGTQIRLLQVFPGETPPEGPKYKLEVVDLKSAPVYRALSYAWGEDEPAQELIVDGSLVLVTKNLQSALHHLTLESGIRKLWVDAICINQGDDYEKSYQVRQMDEIYSKASSVLVWLGEASENSALALDTMLRLSSLDGVLGSLTDMIFDPRLDCDSAFETILKSKAVPRDVKNLEWLATWFGSDTSWLTTSQVDIEAFLGTDALVAIMELLHRRWWERLWIIQEFALPNVIMFVCGQQRLSARIVGKALISLSILLGRSKFESLRSNTKMIQLMEDVKRTRLLFELRESVRATDRHNNGRSLVNLLNIARTNYCKNSCDKIFSLLSLIDEEERALIEVDYTIEAGRLFSKVAAKLIRRNSNLDILNCCHSTTDPARMEGLPSWVPDWTMDKTGFSMIGFDFTTSRKTFSASGWRTYHEAWMETSIDGTVLEVEGFRIGTVNKTVEGLSRCDKKAMWVHIIHHWQVLAAEIEAEPFDFWSTILTRSQFWGVQEARLSKASNKWHFMGEEEEDWFKDPDSSFILDLISPKTCFFICEPFMGSTTETVQVGDVICILYGGQTPYILREDGDGYVLIGECYVSGVMKGEAMKDHLKGKYEKEMFYIH